MDMSQARVNASAALGFGLMGTFPSLPPGFSMSTVLQAGSGVSTMQEWGSAMCKKFGKVREASYADRTTQVLNYYIDNGGFYYYDTGGFSDYDAALTAVVKDPHATGVPYQIMQLDSWWY